MNYARQRIDCNFAMSSVEATVRQLRKFRSAMPDVVERAPSQVNADNFWPQTNVSWYEAAAFCNWMSAEVGIPEDQWCYLPNDLGKYGPGMRIAANALERAGYRLPTILSEAAKNVEQLSHLFLRAEEQLRQLLYTTALRVPPT